MVKQCVRMALMGVVCLLSAGGVCAGQTVTAIPQLDLTKFMGAWYEEARLPSKVEKTCVSDATVLYALGDKPRQFQVVTSCIVKNKNPDAWDATGTMAKKSDDGRLTLSYIWPFKSKYWVLAVEPNYEWALIGSPNHKSLWILSRTSKMKPDLLEEIKAKASAQGFDMKKLILVSHRR